MPLAAKGWRIVRCSAGANVICWLIAIFLILMIFGGLHRWLEKIGLGKLPGDFRFPAFWQGVLPPDRQQCAAQRDRVGRASFSDSNPERAASLMSMPPAEGRLWRNGPSSHFTRSVLH